MNREIKFRGKSVLNDEWVYGDLVHRTDSPKTISPVQINGIGVKEDTVGQFTGLFDKNGKEIYEGDIVKFHFMTSSPSTTKLFPTAKFFGEIITNKYNQWAIFSDGMEIHIENAIKHGEIAGNIYDNPDLIKEE
jgi:uncharacterized phage protein (TIGR01671 family)